MCPSTFDTSTLQHFNPFIMNTYAPFCYQAICNEHLRISGRGRGAAGPRPDLRWKDRPSPLTPDPSPLNDGVLVPFLLVPLYPRQNGASELLKGRGITDSLEW